MGNRYIYVVLSHTLTRIGKLLRVFGKIDYNHSAIALDEHFNELYAFARPKYRAFLLGKLVKETYTSYTLNSEDPIPIKVFRIPVSEEAYQYVKETLYNVSNNKDIHYNFFSVITFPFYDGCKVDNTYTCSEFVAHVLKDIGISMPLACCKYKPEDLAHILKDYFYFEGDIRDVLSKDNIDKDFFDPISWNIAKESVKVLYKVGKRSVHYKK